MGFLATLGALIGALIYIFMLLKILSVGLQLSFDYGNRWWGGFAFWAIWVLFWVFGPLLLILSAIQEFN